MLRTTTYCYPWDLARLGVARTLDEIAGHGIEAIDLAANYHPIDALSPRGGISLFSDARGAVYFPARAEGYGRIKPRVHSAEIARAWPEAADRAARIGLGLNSWTITQFQPWIRDAYPDCAQVLPWGDRSGSGVCAANPDVRDYLVALCDDLAAQFAIGLFRLEGVFSHSFDLDWLRPRTLVTIPATARMLSSLCFCASCRSRGTAVGIDVDALQKRVVGSIAADIAGKPVATQTLSEDAELLAFAELQVRASVELVRSVRDRVGPASQVSCNAATPYRPLIGGTREDKLLMEYIEAATQLDLNVLNPAGNHHLAALNTAIGQPRPLSALHVTIRNPTVSSAAQMAASSPDRMLENLQACVDIGVREFALYNYGLLPDADVRAFMEAVGQLRLA